MSATTGRRFRLARPWRDLVEVAALAIGLYIVVSLALQTVRVDGISMVPTLTNGDLLFADRIIGVPGDTIEIDTTTDSDGTRHAAVLVKPVGATTFERLSEPYLPTNDPWTENGFCCDAQGRATVQPQPLTLPKNDYFVMGDNRNVSEDSRALGLIPRANILARAWVRVWPAAHLGALGAGPALVAAGAPILPGLLFLRRRRRIRRRLAETTAGG
ncbi:MAG: signal peptidase I [Chloroflexi bacterium]|nr:MAG: signal peptidase I [Chloroflexota bacterium]